MSDLLTQINAVEKKNKDALLLASRVEGEIEHVKAEIETKRKGIEARNFKVEEIQDHITNEETDVKEKLIEEEEKLQ